PIPSLFPYTTLFRSDPKAVFDTLQIYLGSYYVNDFNQFGRTWQVVVQARGEFRTDPDKIRLLKVRNADGDMVPLGALVSISEVRSEEHTSELQSLAY